MQQKIKIILRIVQSFFAFITMALASAVISKFLADGLSSPSSHAFVVFTSVTALILASIYGFAHILYNIYRLKWIKGFVHWKVETSVTVIYAIFWLAGLISTAVLFSGTDCGSIGSGSSSSGTPAGPDIPSACTVSKVTAAFCFFNLCLWCGSIYFLVRPIYDGKVDDDLESVRPSTAAGSTDPLSVPPTAEAPSSAGGFSPTGIAPVSGSYIPTEVSYGGPGIPGPPDSIPTPAPYPEPLPFPEPTYVTAAPTYSSSRSIPNSKNSADYSGGYQADNGSYSSTEPLPVPIRRIVANSSRPTTPESERTSVSAYPGSADAVYQASSHWSVGGDSRSKLGGGGGGGASIYPSSMYPQSVDAIYAGSSRANSINALADTQSAVS